MNILIISIGTRGDMEPFLAIGRILHERGHTVTCQFPEQFKGLVEDAGFQFETLGTEFMDMLESDLGKFALGGGGPWWRKVEAFVQLARIQRKNNRLMVERQCEAAARLEPDRIVHHGKAMYPVIWEVDHPERTVYISPVPYMHYVKGHTHTAFHSNYGDMLNRLTYKLADWGVMKAIMSAAKELGLSGVSKSQINKVLASHTIIYTVSPHLFPRPEEWPSNMQVLGYHERDKATNWQPTEELLNFLARHDKVLFITFGSMTNPDPQGKTELFMKVLQRHNIPAIINTSSGGLKEPVTYDRDQLHFVRSIPYDWIFPKVFAVVHHGGSGTTHMAVRNGCPSLIIPHIVDQFNWDRIIHEKNIGPKGIRVDRITEKNLEPMILDLMNNPEYKRNALAMAECMQLDKELEEELHMAMIK